MSADVYYNENNPFAATWLEELVAAGALPPGRVDRRSIEDVQPEDLEGYRACHFFGGIGGWPYALQLAGWPEDEEVWTASLPCQPFSTAGKKKGFDDPRHLWPVFRRLVAARRPSVVFGEQSAAAVPWLRRGRSDLGKMGYAVGAIPLQAALVGADHLRTRYYFVADTYGFDDNGSRPDPIEVRQPQSGSPELSRSEGPGQVDWRTGERVWTAIGPLAIGPSMGIVAHGFPGSLGLVRGAGNAVVPAVAAAFISAYREARACPHAGRDSGNTEGAGQASP